MTGNEERALMAALVDRARDVQDRLSTRTTATKDASAVIAELIYWLDKLDDRNQMLVRLTYDLSHGGRATH